ncbi:hypothetical protein [Sphingomonas bacterium]|uniref:hypothetical protein n=1 Tax=Sphingomonas bacterium TaxID=1895847 RepID=UPI001576CB0C|nr:hypothetical protein [Sphingomonas bacterium]
MEVVIGRPVEREVEGTQAGYTARAYQPADGKLTRLLQCSKIEAAVVGDKILAASAGRAQGRRMTSATLILCVLFIVAGL